MATPTNMTTTPIGQKIWLPLISGIVLLFYAGIYILPTTASVRAEFSEYYSVIPLRVLLLLALIPGLSRLPTACERFFWNLVVAAFCSWFVADTLFQYGAGEGIGWLLVEDLGFLLFYPLMILALEQRPHRFHFPATYRSPRWWCMISGCALVVWCYFYFVIAALISDPQAFLNVTPSYAFFVAIDVVLAVVLIQRSFVSSGRWRIIYLLLAITMTLFAATDLLEALMFAERLDLAFGMPIDFLWYAPYFVAIGACWYRNLSRRPIASGPELEAVQRPTLTTTALAYATVIPVVHLIVYSLQWQPEHAGVRETSAVVGLVFMLILALVSNRIERRLSAGNQTRIVLLNEEFQQTQRLESLGRMAGGVAHDFNNLLLIVQVNVELMADKIRTLDGGSEFIDQMESTVRQGGGLTKQLLAFGRQQMAAPSSVDANRVISDAEMMLRRTLGENIQLVREQAEDLWTVEIDPAQLTQILINLSLNAREAMPDGGTLRICTTNAVVGESSAQYADHFVQITVADTGKGMDEPTRQHIFDPFFTTRESTGGTGLGLSVVYGIVKQCGGSIFCRSKPGRGTSFQIHLPRSTSDFATSPDPDSEPGKRLRGSETILLAEDEFPLRRLTSKFLSEAGYRVLDAGSGSEGLVKFQSFEGHVDALVTDIVMPGLGGIELARKVNATSPDTCVVFMSGYAQDQRPDQSGKHGYLQKPFTMRELETTLRDLLDRHVVPR